MVAEYPEHLLRLTSWSLASIAAGLLFLLRDHRSAYGRTTVLWALVHYAQIVGEVLMPTLMNAATHRRNILPAIGLNLAWIVLGALLTRSRRSWLADAGRATMVQGMALVALGLLLYKRLG